MILITGAAGFIGSNLVASLNEAGRDDMVCCDWLGNDGRWENLAKRCFTDFVLPGQLADWLDSPAASRVELVLHMGAISDTTACDGDVIIARNYQFTRRLWAWCADREVTFVYASSAATYGDGQSGFSDALDFDALKRLRPLNLYGWSKHAFDLFAAGAPDVEPPRWYGLKFFNVFGPNEYHKDAMRSVVCKMAPDILSGRPVQLFRSHKAGFADGGQMRDFVFVEDVCRAVLHLARGEAASGLYNIGTGKARSFADLVGAAYGAAGHEPRIEYAPMPEALRPRYQYFTQAEVGRLRAAGFDEPFADLETSVARYIMAFLARDDRYR